MAITKSLDVSAIASATSVSVKQKNQQEAANLRPETIVCIGQAQTGKTAELNKLNLASGNSDDIGTLYGFGSPLHRMAIKLFPKAGNGSKVDTYFLAVDAPKTGAAEVKTVTITAEDGITKSFNGLIILNDLVFEAAADLAGKVATNAHNNPAKAPRGTILNAYEQTAYPFTLTKGMSVDEAAQAIKEALEENLEIPFTVEVAETDNKVTGLTLTAKWVGSDSFFEIKITDENGRAIDSSIYGVEFKIERATESAGVGTINNDALSLLDEELGVTRVVSQYATTTVLDALQEYFEAFHDGLIAQYVICYSAIQAPENNSIPGTWDIASLIEIGTKRREDSINVQIVGDYGNSRKLKYGERNRLLKAGFSNLVKRADGSLKLMDLVSFYHPVGKTNPLFRFDRDITCVANIAYDLMSTFRDSEEWASVVLVGENDITTNPVARTLKQIKAAVNTRLSLLGRAAIIANYIEAQKGTELEIDSSNPNRVNINPNFDLTGVGRIFDITNFIGFNFKG